MQVRPVGISASTLSVFWPLWDAALLRRYGRSGPGVERLAVAMAATWLQSRRPGPRPPLCYALPPGHQYQPPPDPTPPPQEALPPLQLHWPSDDPPVPPQIIVVERWLRESPPAGDLIDVLF